MADTESSKFNANIKHATGVAQETAGSLIGNEQMQVNGAARKAEADAEYKAAEAKGYAEGVVDNMKGKAKDAVGALTGDDKLQAEGKADKASGDAKKVLNS